MVAKKFEDSASCTVIVRFEVGPSDQQQLVDLCLQNLSVFQAQPGFVSGTLLRSSDGSAVVNYLLWRSEADHLACMNSPEVAARGKALVDFLGAGRATLEVKVYEVVASVRSA